MKTAHFYFEVAMDGGDSVSEPIRLNQLYGYSMVGSWAASAGREGTLKLQVSNNVFHKLYKNKPALTPFQDMQEIGSTEPNNPDAIWEDVPGSETNVDALAGQGAWNVDAAFYSAVRMVWTETTLGAESPDQAGMYFHAKGNRN